MRRRWSWGAEVAGDGVHFQTFAPKSRGAAVVLAGGREVPLARDPRGTFTGFVPGLRAGARYRYRLDDGVYPDPASRFQPDGPHGESEVVDASAFRWTDAGWKGVTLRGQVVYEMHVGTFTREGTWRAAMDELPELASAGITLLEVMPVAEFAGTFGWGYDGVDLYAPTRLYGRPDELRAFVDRAHALGLGVILDVVYNHVGPSGNHLRCFSDAFFTDRYQNEWGEALDFETEPAVRAFFAENGAYWIDEYHLDGLRLDATQSIHDRSEPHVITELVAQARAAAGERSILVFGENEPQDADLVRRSKLDALWNDDFHHAAVVAATGRSSAYYEPTSGTAQELLSAVKWGFLFQGQHYTWQGKTRGTPAFDLDAPCFTLFLDNHDQIANAAGARLAHRTSPGIHRALTTLLLLAPGTPLLFQGQEFGASSPFDYFADHEPELAKLVAKGRHEFLQQFPAHRGRELPLPHARATFERSKLDFTERETHRATYDLVRDLLRLRREDAVFAAQDARAMHGAVLGPRALLLRFRERLLVVNLGDDLDVARVAEPLVAPPARARWATLFSTEDTKYGGDGVPPAEEDRLLVPGGSAVVFTPRAMAPGATS